MIHITTTCGTKGEEWSDALGHRATSLTGLARKLVNAGVADQPWQAGGLSGPSIHRLATIAIAETDRGIAWVAYVPHPKVVVSPALAHALAEAKRARALHRERRISARAGMRSRW